jgi:hypothetical protein
MLSKPGLRICGDRPENADVRACGTAPPALRSQVRRDGPARKLRALADWLPGGRTTLGTVVDGLGASGTGIGLLLFSLTALIPGIAPVLGVALCAIAAGLVLGREEPCLPRRIRRWPLNSDRLRSGLHGLIPRVEWLEQWLHPRAGHWLGAPGLRLIGVASLINGVLIVLPIPFGNTAPAVAMLILSLGLVTSDGFAVAAGLAATVVAMAVDAALVGIGFAAIGAVVASVL